ncbi:hypothetical protein LTR36_008085 [Oleoguttula mirabilis]|uniref:2-dehydropantoate 2-reductase n=1 Tax=Oleoguttula mirabilis TaxID=1507867 RepID=A0AAV9J9D1_9PEZI|nr:hypothetical protein LTR36_008085 [Oleoguttula mirabilis]
MADQQQTKVLLFGLGAIGGFYAFILGQNPNVSLSVVARSNYDSVKANGLLIESQNHGNHKVEIDQVLKSPADSTTKFDYIVCAHKAVNPDKVPPILKPVVGDNTTFVIIQNGVGNEEPFRHTYPNNTILSCVTWVGATQVSPGLIQHTKSEDMQMGLFPNPNVDHKLEKAKLDAFAAFLTKGNTVFQVEDNIQIKRWEKVVWNAAWNPLTTLTDVDTQTWLKSSPEATPMTKRLMREVIDVAKRCDVPIGYDLADSLVDKILAMPGIYSSMHTDAKGGRPLEVEVILGYPMKKAREFEMDVPVLSAVYAMTMAVNGRLVAQSKL